LLRPRHAQRQSCRAGFGPGMPKLSPARAAARRQQIIDAAIVCFADRGFYRSTLQDVVRASGFSPGSIYYHFASKEDIVHAVIDQRHRSDLRKVELAADAGSLEEGLLLLAHAFFPAPSRPEDRAWRRLAVQLWAESHHDAKLLRAVRDGVDKPLAGLSDLLRKAQKRGELPRRLDPKWAARVLIASFQGITLQQSWTTKWTPAPAFRAIQQVLLRIEA
jgi:AcrR family transcriptional regulator